jgi:APA family basic amino acid/polyamine antiporter
MHIFNYIDCHEKNGSWQAVPICICVILLADPMKFLLRAFKTKSLQQLTLQRNSSPLERTFGFFDLLCVGVGSTIGSGIFVLTGFIALRYSGPSIVFSWLLAGAACCFSAVSFAELSCKYPSAGSSYSFASVSLGEWPAYIAACCLTLECGVSSSAVARSWGFKLNRMLAERGGGADGASYNSSDSGVNWYAAALELGCVLLFLCGVEAGKMTVNVLTVAKLILITFIVVMGFSMFHSDNFDVMMPMGASGLVKGATFGFFGFVGYDEVR